MKKIIIVILGFFALNVAAYGQAELDNLQFSVSEYQIIGDNPLGQKAYDVLQPFIGDQYGLEGLSAAADALEQLLITSGYSFHRVNLPPQALLSGSVILEVVQFKIGQVQVTGNRFFDDENIKRSVPGLKAGTAPNMNVVSSAVKAANNHSSKTLVLQFKDAEEPNTIDAELKVADRNPSTFFASLDNTGGHDTEANRLTLGYQNSNLFNKDHALTLTYTTAPEDTEVASQYGISYQIPFYSNASHLNFLLSDSESNTGKVADNNLVTGKGSVFGITYGQSIYSTGNIIHNWSVGLTYKLFDNTQLSTTSTVLSFPLELAYNFRYKSSAASLSAGFSLAANTGSGDDNTDDAYDAARSNATKAWSAARYHLTLDYLFAKAWLFHLGLSGQSSADRLISGEQFGVGGSASLRGFEERSINGDEGQALRMELWMPAFTRFNLRVLVFADQAQITSHETNTLLNDGLDESMASVGLGLRWSWKQQFSVSIDYGKITKEGGPDTSVNREDDTKTHVSLLYRF